MLHRGADVPHAECIGWCHDPGESGNDRAAEFDAYGLPWAELMISLEMQILVAEDLAGLRDRMQRLIDRVAPNWR